MSAAPAEAMTLSSSFGRAQRDPRISGRKRRLDPAPDPWITLRSSGDDKRSEATEGESHPRRAEGDPRARVEHAISDVACGTVDGSSPRSRGTRSTRRLRARNDPRARGEHWRSREPVRRDARFIPALTGNRRAHERDIAGAGSSPRSRGTFPHGSTAHDGVRFIPALAGNTLILLSSMSVAAVHPRARGEHQHPELRPSSGHGSSPRSRGTLLRSSRPGSCVIPALRNT